MHRFVRTAIHHFGNLVRGIQLAYLRMAGVEIGNNTMISLHAKIDVRRGRIVIGNDCHITYGCVILSHDGAARQIDPRDDGLGRVIIGDGVFVGVNSTILPNVTIGDGTVIAAGSVVTRSLPAGVVAAGNPARVIREINQTNKR